MNTKSDKFEIGTFLKKFTNKDIFTITTAIYFAIIVIYELFYCNFEFVLKIIPTYNFSLYRFIAYLIIYLVFYKFKDKFIERAIDGFQSKFKCYFVDISIIIILSILIASLSLIIITKTFTISNIILFISGLMLSLLIFYISNNMLQNVVVTALLIGTIFSISITFNNQLDEKRHFLSSYSIATGNFNLKKASIDESVAAMPKPMNTRHFIQYFKEYPTNNITKEFSDKAIEDTPTDYLNFSYIISGLGIFIAKTLGGSIADIYITGRIFNLLGYIFIMVLALKVLPYKKNILYAMFFMPMLLALASVYSVDGIGTAIIALFIAYCLKLQQQENITIKETIYLIILLILAALIKSVGYVGIALIIFILPLKKIIKQNKKYMKYIAIFFAAIICIITLVYIMRINEPGDSRMQNTNTLMQFKFIMQNPLQYAKILLLHIIKVFKNIKGLSFLNAPMYFNTTYYYVFIVLTTYLLFISITDSTKQLNYKTRLVFIFTFLTILAMTSTAMYLGYTPVGANYILGFQMRYMFPILFLLLSSISITRLELKNNFKFNTLVLSYISSIFLIISVVDVII